MDKLQYPKTPEDASGGGQDHGLYGLCPTCSQTLPHSPSQATGINPTVSLLSLSPVKGGFAELPPRAAIRRCLSDVLPVPVASPPRTGVISSGQGELYRSLHKRDLTASEDVSGDGQPQLKRRDVSVQDCPHGFSRVPLPLCGSCFDAINSAFFEVSKQSPHSLQAAGIDPNVSTLSPSPANGASTQRPPLLVLQRSVSDLLPLASPPRSGVISGTDGDVPMGSPVITQEIPHHEPPRPPLRRCFSDVLPVASSPRTPGDMPTGSPVMTQESPDHERLKRMVERLKEMKQYCETVVLEGEGAESRHNNTRTEGRNGDIEEEVSIERDGEYIRVFLKCTCERAYQFLFSESGSKCYYKLM